MIVQAGADPAGQMLSIAVEIQTAGVVLGPDTDESYSLTVAGQGDGLAAAVSSQTYYGARHAIETLFQVCLGKTFGFNKNKIK